MFFISFFNEGMCIKYENTTDQMYFQPLAVDASEFVF